MATKYSYFFAATIEGTPVNFEAAVDRPLKSLDDIRGVAANVLPTFKDQVPRLAKAQTLVINNFILLRTE